MLLFQMNLQLRLLDFGTQRAKLVALNVDGEVGALDSDDATGPL